MDGVRTSVASDITMKAVLALALLVAVVSALPAGPKYTTKYDNIDLDDILKNDRLYSKYFNCLVNKGKCTPDGKELKDNLPDALATECSKCSERQKQGTEQVLKYLLSNKSSDYDQLEKLYDPSGVYRKRYQSEAKKHGISI